ncbi:hypothetical protein JWS13_01275 (plasmid) [Rhodococcus pseudokoreensis]|uniref:Uncharacterized protein n=1 Tax=Rhodococcus pseudokoreensis TaxID=2811421 RepID=A0A974VZB7_9NOCA|nr:hypothetical protein JWS13_01275 [Rhodococcus pseudokoreensis]
MGVRREALLSVQYAVSRVLGTERARLNPVREALRADDGALHRRLLPIREEAGLPEEISALRLFDVIAWMDGKYRGLGERSDRPGEDATSRGDRRSASWQFTMGRMGIRAAAAFQGHGGPATGSG